MFCSGSSCLGEDSSHFVRSGPSHRFLRPADAELVSGGELPLEEGDRDDRSEPAQLPKAEELRYFLPTVGSVVWCIGRFNAEDRGVEYTFLSYMEDFFHSCLRLWI